VSTSTVINLISQAVVIIAELAGPVLVATLVIGLFVSLVQAVTSLQEFTLTFLPKLVAVAAILAIAGHWMITQVVDYTEQLYAQIPHLLSSG